MWGVEAKNSHHLKGQQVSRMQQSQVLEGDGIQRIIEKRIQRR